MIISFLYYIIILLYHILILLCYLLGHIIMCLYLFLTCIRCIRCILCIQCIRFVVREIAVRPTCKSKAACKFSEKNIKIEVPQYWEYASQTQCKICYTLVCLTSPGVPGKYVLWSIYFSIRILAPMSI